MGRARRPHGGDELRAEEVVDECHDPTFAPAQELVGIAAAGRTIPVHDDLGARAGRATNVG